MKTLKEALITKKNIDRVGITNYYVVFPFGEDQSFLDHCFEKTKFRAKWSYYILTENQIKKHFDSVNAYINNLKDLKTLVWEFTCSEDEIKKFLASIPDSNVEKTKDIINKFKFAKLLKQHK